jgi:hypothetical protein
MPRTLTPIPTVTEQPVMVARDVFPHLHMSDTTGYTLIADGKFPLKVRRVGGRWMVTTADIRRYLGLDAV